MCETILLSLLVFAKNCASCVYWIGNYDIGTVDPEKLIK